VAASAWFATVSHPAKPKGWDICWGPQLDIRTVRTPGAREITDAAVACYLAKYATKSTEAVGSVAVRITPGNLHAYASPFTHHGRLIRAAWNLGHHPHQDFQALRRWAHMLGFRGHFATKPRGYSVRPGSPGAGTSAPPPGTARKPPSSSPGSPTPAPAGALLATSSSPCPPPPAPANTGASPARKCPPRREC